MISLDSHDRPKLTPETYKLLRDVIYDKTGLYFAESKRYFLESRLYKRLVENNLNSFEDYHYFISYDVNKEIEFRKLTSAVVTNETSYFRDPLQLDIFLKGILPKIREQKESLPGKSIRVWSSASSTGEEPYTLAMMLMEEGIHLDGFGIEVFGSDISDTVLQAAERAVYDDYSIRNTPETYLKKYFSKTGESYNLDTRVKSFVKMSKANLIDPADIRQFRNMDVVFCRNVLIYFDDASKKKAVNNIYDSLAPKGYLIVGFSESLHSITRLFKPVNIGKSLVYQKV